MEILFICGCLEPGRDGVGDYARRLAIELIRQGHNTKLMSLNDKYISEQFDGNQQFEDSLLPTLRLPSVWPIDRRINHAKQYIDEFNPDWLSIQFVVYSFHAKGLPFNINRLLTAIGENRKWHIMFHELGIGNNIGASRKDRLIGYIQKGIIKRLIARLKPLMIHTQTKLYQVQLKEMGVTSNFLPLFSNIPVLAVQHTKENDLGAIILVVFGTIHPDSLFHEFAREAVSFSKANKVEIELRIIGRSGNQLEAWISICQLEGLKYILLGEQPPELISKELSNSTIGISTSDILRIEKSGTVAAFLAHGLPVICISKPWIPRSLPNFAGAPPEGVSQYKIGNIEACFGNKINAINTSDISLTSEIFINDLLTQSSKVN